MKLTDIMFNIDYIAANVGADKVNGGNVFAYETITAGAGTLTLKEAAVPVVTNGEAKVWFKKASEVGGMENFAAAEGNVVSGDFEEGVEYCVMYRKWADNAETITINSQFIPETLHAVLTVALYSGDSCNVESATKAGEVVIDIPRFQLTGAMDISMSATGAAQTPLEGNALASGCTGCDGKAIYATITRYISGAHWYDDAQGLVIEDMASLTHPVNKEVVVYAYYANKAPKKLVEGKDFTVTVDGEGRMEGKNFVCDEAGTTTVTVIAKDEVGAPIDALQTNKVVVVG